MMTLGARSRSGARAAVLAVLTLGLVTSQASSEPATAWRFWKGQEGVLEPACHCEGPLQTVAMTFQGDTLYLVSAVPLTVDAVHRVTVEVDGNPAQDLTLRMINSHLFAVEPGEQLSGLIERFYAGSSYSLRATSLDGIAGSHGSLLGFRSAYESFKNCRAAE